MPRSKTPQFGPFLKQPLLPIALALLLASSGCHGTGMIQDLGWYNPWVRPQWVADEEYAEAHNTKTMHSKLDDLANDRARARSMSEEQRAEYAANLARFYPNEKDTVLRVALIKTMAEFPSSDCQKLLTEAIRDPDKNIRIAACDAWRTVRNEQALTMLSEALNSDTETEVRLAAARGLADFKDKRATEALGIVLQEKQSHLQEDPALVFRAMQSLKETTGKDLGNDVVAWRQYLGGETPEPRGNRWANSLWPSLW